MEHGIGSVVKTPEFRSQNQVLKRYELKRLFFTSWLLTSGFCEFAFSLTVGIGDDICSLASLREPAN
jgi:hypothetical protein